MLFMDVIITLLLAVAAAAYAALAVRIARFGPQSANSMICYLMFLMAGVLAGGAFSYGTTDADMYNIGRVLTVSSCGFIPLVFYIISREYTSGSPRPIWVAALAVLPTLAVIAALTNSMHNLLWSVSESANGLKVSSPTDHAFVARLFGPYFYGLFGYSAISLIGRLPMIAPAHRRTITLLLLSALLPFMTSLAGNVLVPGAVAVPLTSIVIALLFPAFAYLSLKLRMHEFSPLAYQTLFDHVRDPIIVVDNEQRIVCTNRAAEELLQSDERELLGRKLWKDFPAARAILKQAKELDLTQTLRMDTQNVYEVSVGPLTGPRGQNLGMVVVCRDVTQRRLAQSKLADSERLIRTLIETSSNGILRFARDENDPARRFRCVFANRAAELFSGDTDSTLVGMPLEKLSFIDPARLLQHFDGDEKAVSQISFEALGEVDDNADCWLRVIGEPVGEDFSVTLIDITKRKRTEDKMLADALRDPLTGVLNRRGFEEKGASCIARSTQGAVLYLDLNAFKSINDRFGHPAGDALLKAFSHRLEFCLRPEDVLGRLGGDEFAIVLPGVGVSDVQRIAGRLVKTASEAYILQGQEIYCTASVGIALMPKHGNELWHLLGVADEAMYNAKSNVSGDAANDRAAYVEAATAS